MALNAGDDVAAALDTVDVVDAAELVDVGPALDDVDTEFDVGAVEEGLYDRRLDLIDRRKLPWSMETGK